MKNADIGQAEKTVAQQQGKENKSLIDPLPPNIENPQMRVWNLVSTSDPNSVKKANVDGRTIASIDGMYVFMQLTRLFGPCGKGWGYEIAEERYDTGEPVFHDGERMPNDTLIHTLIINFWYREEGDQERNQFPAIGHTKFRYWSKNGGRYIVDAEAPKKSLTDAIKKAASMLGVCADVFLGLWDDQSYVDFIRTAASIDAAEERDKEIDKLRDDFARWLKYEKATMLAVTTAHAVNQVRMRILDKLPHKVKTCGYTPEEAAVIRKKIDDAANAEIEKINERRGKK